jgi:hypothetical protein
MVDPLQYIDELAKKARHENPPTVDVSYAVISRLNDDPEPIQWPVLCFTTGVALAAGWTVVSSVSLLTTILDPLASLLQFPPVLFM